jgi:putative lysine transport system substrate-binding protein
MPAEYAVVCHNERIVERYRIRRVEAAEVIELRSLFLLSGGFIMKRTLVLVLAALLIFGACASAATLRVGMECDYAPFNWTQADPSDTAVPIAAGGYADGYDVRIAKMIADGLGMELEVVKTAWDGLPMAVQSGDIDAIIAGMSPTAERQQTLDFSAPYYESDLVVVVRKDSAFAATTQLSDFTGAKITGQLNTFHYTVIDQIPGVDKQTAMETFPAMIVALSAGAIDGYISERPGAMAAVGSNPELAFVTFADGKGFTASPEDVAVAVGLKKGSELTAKINEILTGVTKEQRLALMDACIAAQPLSK